MDRQETANSLERSVLSHALDGNIDTTAPRYDFVLPSYSRDRRVSSVTSTVPSEIIMHANSTNNHTGVTLQNSAAQEAANTGRGMIFTHSVRFHFIEHNLLVLGLTRY